MNLLELERAIANYYASTGHEIETTYTVRPDRQSTELLPQIDNNEGDVIFVKDTQIWHIWDEGEWNELPQEIFKDDALLSKEDVERVVDEALEDDDLYASSEEILEEILKGVEAANG